MDTTIIRCPGCGANLQFDAQTLQWKCQQCGGTYTRQDIQKIAADSDLDTKSTEPQPELTVFRCHSCGAEMVTDANTTATFCVYCHNPGIIKSRLEGQFRPDLIIPFSKTKEDAIAAYNSLRKGKRITFKEFGNRENIEKITGVYVPFWLYDGYSHGHVSCNTSFSNSHRSGDYIITTTKTFKVERDADMTFQNVPADGSVKFDDNTMDSIEPYNFKELIPFNYSYLSGFLAEKYDVDASQDQTRAQSRMENSLMSNINATIGGLRSNIDEHKTTTFSQVKYALLPVWMLNTIVDGKTYTFAMNGQTGRMVGDIPISNVESLKYVIITTLIAMAVLSALTYFLFM
jgi:DNA-directed RNA polymerase subunit RPC12/RpoP